MRIEVLTPNETAAVRQAAQVLVDGFAMMAPDAWPDLGTALEEVQDCLADGRICLVARDDDDVVHGWIGGRHSYARVWELHPLVVHPRSQRRGLGRRLVAALEVEARQRGALTMLLGTDDPSDMTTLSGVDLYVNTWRQVEQIRNVGGHPYEFYERCGYQIVGVVPDANGYGRPDIMMAKRLTAQASGDGRGGSIDPDPHADSA